MADLNIINWEQDADGIVLLTLDDPAQSANIMNQSYIDSMDATLARIDAEKDSIKGIVWTSAKKTFFAGGDLTLLRPVTPDRAAQFAEGADHLRGQLRRLETLGIPVASAINGTALGGGLELTLATHHRVVLGDPKIQLGLPEVQ